MNAALQSFVLLLTFLMTMPAAKAQTPSRPPTAAEATVALVNGKPIAAASFEQALQEQLRMGAQDGVALREAVRRDLVIRAVLVELAEKSRLDSAPHIEQRLAAARQSVLAQAWQQQWLDKNPPTDAELQAEYAAVKERAGTKEVQIRQVVLRDETAAKLVMEQIKAGKTLAEMATAYSLEPLGKEDGGLLPWVTPASLVAPLNEVVARAKVGQRLPEPVRTANGFHIVELVAERPFALPPLDQLRPQLVQAVAQRKLTAAIQEQVNKAKIELK